VRTAEALAARLETLDKLRGVVRTMKALSSAKVRQYEHAVEALGEYYRTVELGLHVVLDQATGPPSVARPAAGEERMAAVVFGTDHGLCGRFNQHLCDHAVRHLDALGSAAAGCLVLAVGGKVTGCLEEAGRPARETHVTPGSAEAITGTVSGILLTLDRWREEQDVERVWLYFNRRVGDAPYRHTARRLLPMDVALLRRAERVPWPTKVLPTFSMPADALLSSLVHQYLFVSLFRACAESQASEHSARLMAMQASERNIGESIEATGTEYRRLRQEVITAEIMDVIAGYEATTGAARRPGHG
jgi:F-type H+-transporting ATPase subunit gamma